MYVFMYVSGLKGNLYSIYNDDENGDEDSDDYNDHDDGTYCFYCCLYRFVSISIG